MGFHRKSVLKRDDEKPEWSLLPALHHLGRALHVSYVLGLSALLCQKLHILCLMKKIICISVKDCKLMALDYKCGAEMDLDEKNLQGQNTPQNM